MSLVVTFLPTPRAPKPINAAPTRTLFAAFSVRDLAANNRETALAMTRDPRFYGRRRAVKAAEAMLKTTEPLDAEVRRRRAASEISAIVDRFERGH